MKTSDLFTKVILKGILGAITGIISGWLLGVLIWLLLLIGVSLNNWMSLTPGMHFYSGPPFEIFILLGMCFGAIIGSIFGSLTALKENKKS